MHPIPLVAAAALAGYIVLRRNRLGRTTLIAGGLAVFALALYGFGVIRPPNLTNLLEDAGRRLGTWTYVLVGVLTFLETGAFIGFVAPGETGVLVGGVVAGQGEISIVALIGLVWICAVAGDTTSFMLGRRLGRGFMLRHGPRFKITEERFERVEQFFQHRGGAVILVGRFIGLVRPLAPFIAGASGMRLRTFLPYDVLGAGLWSATFCLLGYVFWRSLNTLEAYVGRGLLAFGALAALVTAVVYLRTPAHRARVLAWLERQPWWPRMGRPLADWLRRVAAFFWDRVTPGRLGLELTTLLALAGIGGYSYVALRERLHEQDLLAFDRQAFDLLGAVYDSRIGDVVRVFTDLGSLAVAATITLLTAGWAIWRRWFAEACALIVSLGLTWAAVHLLKAAEGRARPPDPHVETTYGLSFPSGHSAYAIALVACAIALARGGHRLATRFALVTIAIVLATGVAVSRVYLRAHYLSDVLAGLALATAIYSVVGIAALIVAYVRDNHYP